MKALQCESPVDFHHNHSLLKSHGKWWELDILGLRMFLFEGILPIEWLVLNELEIAAIPNTVMIKTVARAIIVVEDWSLGLLFNQMKLDKFIPNIMVVSSGDPSVDVRANVGILAEKFGLRVL